MRKFRSAGGFLAASLLCVGCSHFGANEISEREWNSAVQREVKTALTTNPRRVDGEWLTSPKNLARFYQTRSYTSAWTRDRSFSDQAEPLLRMIASAGQEGLLPSDYHAAAIDRLWKSVKERGDRPPPVLPSAALDLLLTDAYLVFASHLAGGKVDEEDLDDKEAFLPHERPAMTAVLRDALARNRVEDSLKELQPDLPGFEKLREALEDYKELARQGGWPMVPHGPVLKRGKNSPRVVALKRRLMASGELSRGHRGAENLFDEDLEKALVKFQQSHGISAKGILNARTLSELNIPVGARIAQIQANLERWRWLSRAKEDRYLAVNTADYRVQLFEGGKPTLTMRAIIGLRDNETPVFTDEMTHLVVNPSWYVPRSIAAEEILPKIQKDPAYLKKMDIQIFEGTGKDKREVNAETVNWSQVSEEHFPYQFRQAPGPNNPLGSMKFIFPNPHGVYLHGTLNPKLFESEVRAFSHGCIRIENPLALAAALLKDAEPAWNESKLRLAMANGDETTITLPKPLPIHIQYWTAWVNDAGTLQFRPDIYSWDRTLVRALRQPVTPLTLAE